MIDVLNAGFSVFLLLLTASGLAVIFGLMRVINFAHGEFIMFGAFAALWATPRFGFWFALAISSGFVIVWGLVIETSVIRRLYQRPLETILATFGIGILMRETMKLGVGPEFRGLPNPLPGTVEILGAAYPKYRLAVLGITLALFVTLGLGMRITRFGVIVRAVIENPDLAASAGVNIARTYRVTFAVGSALAGITGGLIAPLVTTHPEMGPAFVVRGFLAVIVGGPGSLGGLAASVGILGSSQSIVTRWVGGVAGSLTIVILSIILMRIRPHGLTRRSTA